jgi:type I restriction enzyme M protein
VLFRGNAEGIIRENLIKKGFILGIIGLPANLFFGTGIPACIIAIDKENAHSRKGIFMIDASSGFMKDGNKNRLRDRDIHKIVDVFNQRLEIPQYSRTVALDEIAKNDYNLNLPRYIDSQQTEDLQDLSAHLSGGIPQRDVDALHSYWDVCPQLKSTLFAPGRPGYLNLAVPPDAIKSTIYSHPEFVAFMDKMKALYAMWQQRSNATLKALQVGCHPKAIIHDLSNDLLSHYAGVPLMDAYGVYQHLMDYWASTMQDDCYLIASDGWKAPITRVLVQNAKGKAVDKGWTCELIPKSLVVQRYFASAQKTMDELQTKLDAVTAQMTELEEEHGGEEGLFCELDKVNKAQVSARLKDIKNVQGDQDAKDEFQALSKWLKLCGEETDLKKMLKEAETALDALVHDRYTRLTEADIKTLVVDDKWLCAIGLAVHGEMDRISQALTQRVKVLTERYATPLPQLTDELETLASRVDEHLKIMGLVWNTSV